MTKGEAAVKAAAGTVPEGGRTRGFFSLPGRRDLLLTVYRTLLFTGLALLGFEFLVMDADVLGVARTLLDMHGVAARLVPSYRTDLDMDAGFLFMGALATVVCFLVCLPLRFLHRHHPWLLWLLFLLLIVELGTPQF